MSAVRFSFVNKSGDCTALICHALMLGDKKLTLRLYILPWCLTFVDFYFIYMIYRSLNFVDEYYFQVCTDLIDHTLMLGGKTWTLIGELMQFGHVFWLLGTPVVLLDMLLWYESVHCWMVLDSSFIVYLVCRSQRLRLIHLSHVIWLLWTLFIYFIMIYRRFSFVDKFYFHDYYNYR